MRRYERTVTCSTPWDPNSTYPPANTTHHYWPPTVCPLGSSWDDASKKCETVCPAGEVPDPENPGQCLNPNDCLQRNGGINTSLVRFGPKSRCNGGCVFASTDGDSVTVGGKTFHRGTYSYTGATCAANPPTNPDAEPPPPEPENKPEECVDAGSGQTYCVKENGQHCASASNGREICWGPGETGTKTDGPVSQKRDAGPTPIPPNLSLPNGDTLETKGPPITVTTQTGGTTITTITTTTTNYGTKHGTNAGGKDDGQPTGTPGGEGEEEGEGEKGAPSTDCTKPPACSSVEAIGCAMLRQQWTNHCQTQSWLEVPAEIADAAELADIPGFTSASSKFMQLDGSGESLLDGIDTGGWAASGRCPVQFQFSAFGRQYTMDGVYLCMVFEALASLILLLGGIHAAMIIYSGSRK